MTNLEFENRNYSSVPIIKRITFKDYYIYYIIEFNEGCTCGYAGCDNYSCRGHKIKVRNKADKKDDCKIILNKKGTVFHKLPFGKIEGKLPNYENFVLTAEEVLEVTLENWNLN